MGYALGEMGMSLDDFCRLSPREFRECSEAHRHYQEQKEQARWERMRLLACICIQPHIKGKMTPQKLVPLPWDKRSGGPTVGPEKARQGLTMEEGRVLTMEEAIELLGETY